MKCILSALVLLLMTSTAEAGRARTARVRVLQVQCVVLESLPVQYAGTASLRSLATGNLLRMRFLASTNADVRNVCERLRANTGRNVTAYYNFRDTVPVNPIRRVIHGFSRLGSTYLINGSIFEDITE